MSREQWAPVQPSNTPLMVCHATANDATGESFRCYFPVNMKRGDEFSFTEIWEELVETIPTGLCVLPVQYSYTIGSTSKQGIHFSDFFLRIALR